MPDAAYAMQALNHFNLPMKRTASILIVSLFPFMGLAGTLSFDDLKVGEAPPGWLATVTGTGQAKWEVVADNSAPSKPQALKQSSETPKASFPICLNEGASLKDGWVEVKFKPLSGKIDQAGGVVWRAKDKDNYYVCRANGLEDNVVLYKTEHGKRKALDIAGRSGGYGVTTKVAPGHWHTIRVEFSGPRFKVIFDGKELFAVEDATFSDSGMVGLWTKADSVTLFDDFGCGKD